MTLLSGIYDIIIAPIEYLIELVFCFLFYNFHNSFGVMGAIIGISLAVNILALPLYLKADELQLAERRQQERMGERIKKIKKAFQGDEQFMMLTEYYRRNHYHPLYALRSSLSILIEIPFFIAAYHFLSNCVLLNGRSEWIFSDLSQPDQLLWGLNVLPILMTVINIISTAVYTKGAPIREKAQAYLLALIFLLILYQSPSGLVFYWILNNLFSLVKNIVMKMKRPVYFLYALYAAVAVMFVSMNVFFRIHPERLNDTKKRVLDALTVLWVFIPLYRIVYLKIRNLKKRWEMKRAEAVKTVKTAKAAKTVKTAKAAKTVKTAKAAKTAKELRETTVDQETVRAQETVRPQDTIRTEEQTIKGTFALTVFSCIALWLMAGALLPSSVIATSPTEFAFLGSVDSPLTYIFMNLTFYFGLFVFWPLCIYKMFEKRVRSIFPAVFFGAAVCAVFNIYLFKSQFGNITTAFEPEDRQLFVSSSNAHVWAALLPLVLACFLCVIAFRYHKLQVLTMLVLILALTEGILSGKNMMEVKESYDVYAALLEERQTDDVEQEIQTEFSLTKTGNNVLVLFCDRFASAYFPYLLEQFPELKETYEGFTYYPNCISFATDTQLGAPAMMGGYEYTPLLMNQREERLVDIHNEATLVLPVWFDQLGYDVKIVDPPLVNYAWDGDYTPFEAYPEIEVCSLINNYVERYEQEHREEYSAVDYGKISIKNCRLYAMLQMVYPPLRNVLAGSGRYYSTDNYAYTQQEYFIRDYAYATYLPQITDAENDRDTYTFIELDTAHEYQLLLEPDYRSGMPTQEHPYAGIGSYPEDASIVDPEKNQQSYHVNACTILLIAKYLDALKEMGVYDNTRIIIVADHGSKIPTAPFWGFADPLAPSNFNPMLLVKDFNSTGEVRTDMMFRTNADMPYLATEGLGALQVNPFTGNPFTLAEEGRIYDLFDGERGTSGLDKELYEFTFNAQYTVIGDNIFEEENWGK